MTQMVNPALALTKQSFEAYVRKDRALMESILAEDFHFSSPLDNRLDRKTYLERCWPNSQHIAKFDFINLVPNGEQVFVTYEGLNDTGKRFRNTEIFTVRGGKIAEVEVYFGWNAPHKAPPGGFIDTPDSGAP